MVMEFIKNKIHSGMEDSFFVVDLGEALRRVELWEAYLPNVKPFYAVKSCPDLELLKTLAKLNVNFDCASQGELELILNLKVDPNRIIYANPCKQPSHVRFSRDNNVTKTTFDNCYELIKIKQHYANAELFLLPFGAKFGANVGEDTLNLLKQAKALNLNVVGISFHVGSECLDPTSYAETIRRSRIVHDQAKSIGFDIQTLDIGGGMPDAKNDSQFIEIARNIRKATSYYFPEGIRLIAEPGRFFSASIFTLATNVIAKRKKHGSFMYYLNDGVFKSFSEGGYIKSIVYYPNVLFRTSSTTETYPFTLWGPALGAKDKINTLDSMRLPELEVGDWLYFNNMGAYSVCFNMEFNGFKQSPRFYINSELEKYLMQIATTSLSISP
ncbi:Ornithine decarboxylase [Massospora cicadina]|nr:Ornithine decarboxylase [Massospora cicadina]